MKFQAKLRPDPTGTGALVVVPREVERALELKGRPKVQTIIAGHPYRGSLIPTPDGFALGVLKAIRQAAGLERGDLITVEVELDTAPRVIEPPGDLASALARDKRAAAAWEKLSYTNKREIAMSLEEAKKPETREGRLKAALERLRG